VSNILESRVALERVEAVKEISAAAAAAAAAVAAVVDTTTRWLLVQLVDPSG
jgi:hypothetical protein